MRSIATRGRLRAYAQSYSAVEVETPSVHWQGARDAIPGVGWSRTL
jgi:hypothetical protein